MSRLFLAEVANGKIKGTVTVRIPSMRYESDGRSQEARRDQEPAVNTQDVSKQYVDLEAVKSKRTLEERLTEILKEQGLVKGLLEIGSHCKVREEIEQIQGELKYYDNLVNLDRHAESFEKDIGQPFGTSRNRAPN